MRSGERHWLVERIAVAMAAGAALSAGCGDRARSVTVSDGGGSGTGTSGSEDWADESTGWDSSSSTSTDTGDEDGDKLDVAHKVDVSMPPYGECEENDGPGDWLCPAHEEAFAYFCISPPAEGEMGCDIYAAEDVVQILSVCGDFANCAGPYDVACGPDPAEAELCCYWMVMGEVCPGRPFVVDGRARVARVVARAGWAESVCLELGGLDRRTRAALASAWAEQGSFEHAAVASFARFCLQLLAVGAPPELVCAAQRASVDELRHARVFFGLASAYAGRELGPGMLDVSASVSETDLGRVAAETAAQACIAETVSVMQLIGARRVCRDAQVCGLLDGIVAEELAHVDLAWAFVTWALQHGDRSVRCAVERVFARAPAHVARGPWLDPRADAGRLQASGQLGATQMAAIARRTLAEIVAPCARALFDELLSPSADAGAAPIRA